MKMVQLLKLVSKFASRATREAFFFYLKALSLLKAHIKPNSTIITVENPNFK